MAVETRRTKVWRCGAPRLYKSIPQGGRSEIPTPNCALFIVHCKLYTHCSVRWLLSEKLGCPSIAVTPHHGLHFVRPDVEL